jgi:Xaa-Pro aminopeptidase
MRTPLENMKTFADRRDKLAKTMAGGALILASPEETIRNGSVHHSFRQDSSLYYLTGFEEPGSIFVFRPGMTPETVLFCRTKNRERETWDGFRFGPAEAKTQFRMEQTFPLEEFDNRIVGLLKGVEKLYYRQYKNHEMDEKIRSALTSLQSGQGRTGFGLLPVLDSELLVGEVRLIKEEVDLHNMRKAGELSSLAHVEVMKAVKAGKSERELHGYFIYQIMKQGAAREGYGSIFAGGANACTLHYVFNDQALKSGDLLLVDAGGEYNYFTADITRTYPVNGKFSEPQKLVYEGVLKIQKAIIEFVKPGVKFQEFHDMGADMLTDLMLDLGLLTGRKSDIIAANEHRKYYPHGIGHFLGMDVHDTGMYYSFPQKDPRPIEPGMVFTVEPGLYIPADDTSAAPELRGIGVRIEDNILVTRNGHENLTRTCPKEVADLERIIGTGL